MTQDNEYDLRPPEKKEAGPKPGERGWVAPTPVIEPADPPPLDYDSDDPGDPDIQVNKAFAILGYVLFIIPLVAAPQSRFARFHANQGLILFILWCIAFLTIIVLSVAWNFASGWFEHIWVLRAFFGCIVQVVMPLTLLIGLATLTLQGIIHAANGERKNLPLIGHWTLLK